MAIVVLRFSRISCILIREYAQKCLRTHRWPLGLVSIFPYFLSFLLLFFSFFSVSKCTAEMDCTTEWAFNWRPWRPMPYADVADHNWPWAVFCYLCIIIKPKKVAVVYVGAGAVAISHPCTGLHVGEIAHTLRSELTNASQYLSIVLASASQSSNTHMTTTTTSKNWILRSLGPRTNDFAEERKHLYQRNPRRSSREPWGHPRETSFGHRVFPFTSNHPSFSSFSFPLQFPPSLPFPIAWWKEVSFRRNYIFSRCMKNKAQRGQWCVL